VSEIMVFYSKTEQETFNYAKSLADKVQAGDIFLIDGDLGVGKSVFVRGLAKGLGVDEAMPSPSFTIVNEYQGKFPVFHFDFYRINDPVELYEIGFEDYIYSNGISFIEWPSKASHLVPVNVNQVKIKIVGKNREINIIWTR
jgi:tRNA threonylcarbamoyladenosine biosynthesis protein TsaE